MIRGRAERRRWSPRTRLAATGPIAVRVTTVRGAPRFFWRATTGQLGGAAQWRVWEGLSRSQRPPGVGGGPPPRPSRAKGRGTTPRPDAKETDRERATRQPAPTHLGR